MTYIYTRGNKMKLLGTSALFFYGFVSAVVAMCVALYFQYVDHFAPCPLCIFQRVATIGAGLVFLIAAIHRPKGPGVKVYAVLLLIILIAGISISLRQVHLQNLPAGAISSCGPGLNYLLQENSFFHAFKVVLQGSGDCATVHFRLLGLSIAGWTAIYFALLILMNVYQLFRRSNKG